MSTIHQSKVKTLSDQAQSGSAQWADQANLGRPAGERSHTLVEGVVPETGTAVAGRHGTDASLFEGLQLSGERSSKTKAERARRHSPSKAKRRTATRNGSAARDRRSPLDELQGGMGVAPQGHPTANRSAKPNVMTAELPFATKAPRETAEQRKLRRKPDAGPYRAMQMDRRSSQLPPSGSTFAPETQSGRMASMQSNPELQNVNRGLTVFSPTGSLAVTPMLTPSIPDCLGEMFPGIPRHTNTEGQAPPTGAGSGILSGIRALYAGFSQLLAKPEVSGYLLMGALIACTFLI